MPDVKDSNDTALLKGRIDQLRFMLNRCRSVIQAMLGAVPYPPTDNPECEEIWRRAEEEAQGPI